MTNPAFRRLYDQGLYDYQIAEELETTLKAARDWRIGAGLPPNRTVKNDAVHELRERLYRQGMSDQEIAAMEGVKVNSIIKWRHNRGYMKRKPPKGKVLEVGTKPLRERRLMRKFFSQLSRAANIVPRDRKIDVREFMKVWRKTGGY